MISNQQMNVPCTRCGTPTPIQVFNVLDVQNQPELKSMLLSEQLNTAPCPQCGHINRVSTPLLYHDASKELLIALVPMELGTGKQETERAIGDLMNRLTASIPKEQFKAYMFSPKRAITLKGMLEQIMEADGIDPEEINRQKERIQLLQQMIMTTSETSLLNLIAENDAKIDLDLFQSITITAQRAQAEGRNDILQKLMLVQQTLLEKSTFGQELAQKQQNHTLTVQAVAQRIQTLGQNATRDDFRQLAIEFAEDDDKLQALVGLVRPAFDYQFFEELTTHIEQAPQEQRPTLETLRDRLNAYTQTIDAEVQQDMQQAAQFLQHLFNSPDFETILADNLELINDDFMSVLAANLQEAERRQDPQTSARLRQIYEAVVTQLQSQMPPEMRLINDLLAIENPDEVARIAHQRTDEITQDMPAYLAEVEKILEARGQTAVLQRFYIVRDTLLQILKA